MDFVAYAAIFSLSFYFWLLEKKDIQCPTFESSFEECKNHGGMSFSYTNPEEHDSPDQIVSKIHKVLGSEQSSIKWRRSFTLAVASVAICFFLIITPGELPDWKAFYLCVLVVFTILFFNFNYYSYHVYGVAEEWGKQNLEKLKRFISS